MLTNCLHPRVHALIAAWLSVFSGLAVTLLSLLSAIAENSMSLYALSLLAAVDTATSFFVIVFWQGQSNDDNRNMKMRIIEQRYTSIIGTMMIFMGVLLIGDR